MRQAMWQGNTIEEMAADVLFQAYRAAASDAGVDVAEVNGLEIHKKVSRVSKGQVIMRTPAGRDKFLVPFAGVLKDLGKRELGDGKELSTRAHLGELLMRIALNDIIEPSGTGVEGSEATINLKSVSPSRLEKVADIV